MSTSRSVLAPSERRVDRITSLLQDVRTSLDRLSVVRPLKAVLLARNRQRFCAHELSATTIDGIDFEILPDIAQAGRDRTGYDFCILCCQNHGEEAVLLGLRKKQFAKLYFAWMWDNHHHHVANLRTAMLADVVFPTHWHERHYLNHPAIVPGTHIPTHSRQWSPAAIARRYPEGLPVARKDSLFGGFGSYQWTPERNAFIQEVMTRCPNHALSLVSVNSYFLLPEADRLSGWAEHKVHLVVPIARDVSSRIFEALTTGQIPLVPDDVPDLDHVVDPRLQRELPILRYRSGSVESVQSAWREGLRRFDVDGAAGVERRREFACDQHSLKARLSAFAAFVRRPPPIVLESDGRVGLWANWK